MLTWTAPLAAVAFYLRLGEVFRRFRATGAAAQARMLAFLMLFALRSFDYAGASPWGSPGLFIVLPSYQHGRPSMPAFLLRRALSADLDNVLWGTVGAAVPLCGTYLIVRLLVVALRARPATATPAAPSE